MDYGICDESRTRLSIRLTCMKVRPSSRNSRNGTSESIGLRSSDQPVLVKNCDPVTAQIGVWTPIFEWGDIKFIYNKHISREILKIQLL